MREGSETCGLRSTQASSACATTLEKAMESLAGIKGLQQCGNKATPKQEEILTWASRSPRPFQRKTTLLRGPGTYKKTLTNMKIYVFRENFPEIKLNEDDWEIVRMFCDNMMNIHKWSGQMLIKVIDSHRLSGRNKLQAVDDMNLHDCWRQTASPPKSKATKMDQGFKPRA